MISLLFPMNRRGAITNKNKKNHILRVTAPVKKLFVAARKVVLTGCRCHRDNESFR